MDLSSEEELFFQNGESLQQFRSFWSSFWNTSKSSPWLPNVWFTTFAPPPFPKRRRWSVAVPSTEHDCLAVPWLGSWAFKPLDLCVDEWVANVNTNSNNNNTRRRRRRGAASNYKQSKKKPVCLLKVQTEGWCNMLSKWDTRGGCSFLMCWILVEWEFYCNAI